MTEARDQNLEAQALERLKELKDDFLSTVSHEQGSSMINLLVAATLLDGSLNKSQQRLTWRRSKIDTSSTARYLQIIKNEGQRAFNLIHKGLELQRLEAGVQTFDYENIHFQTWLPQVVKPFEERAKSRQQTLEVDLPANLPIIVSNLNRLKANAQL